MKMLRTILPILLLAVLLCSFRTKDKIPKRKQHIPQQDLSKWEVPEGVALKMIAEYTHCTSNNCHEEESKVIAKHRNIKKALFKYYKINFFNKHKRVKWVNARFTAADEDQYRKARGFGSDDPRGMVRGYKTKLLVILADTTVNYGRTKITPLYMVSGYGLTFDLSMFATSRYYNLGTICPPPINGCG